MNVNKIESLSINPWLPEEGSLRSRKCVRVFDRIIFQFD
jgi:hypothetical protein